VWSALKAVLAAFFGVRSRKKAAKPIKVWQLILAGVMCALVLALLVWLGVHHLVAAQR
jgi:drug/metabolite transporter (DMT)-like permease